ncbi:MAG: DUF58 domain-containing protein [Dehalococcoidia bacterium]|nr:DUF58 domain-containing protein [Dehalococcoidia bacterium]
MSSVAAEAVGKRSARRSYLDEALLRKLDRLRIMSQRMHASGSHGGRRSRKRGTSVEFADYREYTPGDDLRQIDWNIYGRSNRLYVKLREDEESLAVYLLLDCSSSMDWGQANKLAFARRVAASLGYVALNSLDRVGVYAFSNRLHNPFPLTSGRAQARRLFDYVEQLGPAGETDVRQALRSFAALHRRSGLAIILSDLMSVGSQEGLTALLDRGFEAVILHILDPQETDPEVEGEVELVDRETRRTTTVTVDPVTLENYKIHLAAWLNEIESFCLRRQVKYVPVSSSTPLDDVLFRQLRLHRVVV